MKKTLLILTAVLAGQLSAVAQTGNIYVDENHNGHKITGLPTPSASGEAANKGYVDSVGGGGGGGTWGSITGTLSDQTDLQSALDAKQNSLGFTAVPNTRTVNGHALSSNVTVTASDLSLVIGTNVEAWDADLDALAALSGTHTIYYRSASNTWSAVTVGSGLDFTGATLSATGGSAVWGGITGTLSSQTDLQSALDAKQPLDGDLTALAAVTGTNTIYYRSASNTWTAVTMGGNMTFSGGTLDTTAGSAGVSDTAFASSWNGVTGTAPSKNAVYDEIHLFDTADDGSIINAGTGFRIGGAASSGKILVGNGTNYVASTPTFPNASATSGKVIKSDGTNWVASTETYAAPGTSGNVLTSDGTNWTSAAPSGGGGGPTNADSPHSTIAINVTSGSPADIVTKSITYSAGDTVLFKIWGAILNNSGGSRAYTFKFNLGSMNAVAALGSVIVTSSSNRSLVYIQADFSVNSSSSARLFSRIEVTSPTAIGTAVVFNSSQSPRLYQTSGSNLTGAQTTNAQIYSDTTGATQSFELASWTIEKIASNP